MKCFGAEKGNALKAVVGDLRCCIDDHVRVHSQKQRTRFFLLDRLQFFLHGYGIRWETDHCYNLAVIPYHFLRKCIGDQPVATLLWKEDRESV